MAPYYKLLITRLNKNEPKGEEFFFPQEPEQTQVGSGGLGKPVSSVKLRADVEKKLGELGLKYE